MSIILDLQIVCDELSSTKIPEQAMISRWVDVALTTIEFSEQAEITIRVVDKAESQQLNHQYRGKDKPTNVLSFPFEMPDALDASELKGFLGDVVICADVVEQEANAQGKTLQAHWAHMCIHGVLHLLGYDHIEPEEAEKMESIEIDLLASLGYADPYQIK